MKRRKRGEGARPDTYECGHTEEEGRKRSSNDVLTGREEEEEEEGRRPGSLTT
jgi:hypothetical protein